MHCTVYITDAFGRFDSFIPMWSVLGYFDYTCIIDAKLGYGYFAPFKAW